MITPKEIASVDSITGVKLSNDTSRIVYSVGPMTHPGDHKTSALWLAETASEGSAKQITSGQSYDHSAAFDPDGSYIYFLSDNHKVGGPTQIYRLAVSSNGDAIPITSTTNLRAVSSFSISPDGAYIAFISPDECTDDEKAKQNEAVTDPEIWGENKVQRDLGRLRLLNLDDFDKKHVHTLVSVEANVDSFVWNPDSSQIAYRLSKMADMESNFLPVWEQIIHLTSTPTDPTRILEHPRMPGSRTIWTQTGSLFFIGSVTRKSPVSSNALWKCPASEYSSPTWIAYGKTDDLNSIVDLGFDGKVAVEVADGLQTRIDIIDSANKVFTVFETADDAIESTEWDIKRADDGNYVFVALRSSCITGEPQNIWSGSTESGKKGTLSRQLSSHHQWFAGKDAPISKPFYWTSSDGQSIQGIISYPPRTKLSNLPTVVVPHGGPYGRDPLDLYFGCDQWRPFLASHGYLVLSPNYRGSLGRGDDFAKAAAGGLGIFDWADIESMIDEAIARGIADPDRLGIAGVSQGGFLAAWGCTRPDSRFKAGVVSAGPTEWGSLCMSDDMPDLTVCNAGGAPWTLGEPRYLRPSPIRYVHNVQIPLLILHGKEDKRVPVMQAIGFMRGLMRAGKGGEKSQLVIYPREGHLFEERAHAEDVCRRLLEYLNRLLK